MSATSGGLWWDSSTIHQTIIYQCVCVAFRTKTCAVEYRRREAGKHCEDGHLQPGWKGRRQPKQIGHQNVTSAYLQWRHPVQKLQASSCTTALSIMRSGFSEKIAENMVTHDIEKGFCWCAVHAVESGASREEAASCVRPPTPLRVWRVEGRE